MSLTTYRSYAKINLYLDVLDRRPDGFTDIETVFQTIDLWDALHFEPCDEGLHVTCSNPAVGDARNNLVYRAAALISAHCGVSHGMRIHLDKHIPVAAGLAGGSGNAAAALIALNDLWSLRLTDETLATLALELGSDVPYCLRGGTAAATGRGEALEMLPPIAPMWVVLVHPPLAITAGHAYGHPMLTRNLAARTAGKTPAFHQAIARLAAGDVAGMIFNRMESGIFHEHPALGAIKARLVAAGCRASAMSGSGPTVFGLCDSEDQAMQAAAAFDDYQSSVRQTATRGVARYDRQNIGQNDE